VEAVTYNRRAQQATSPALLSGGLSIMVPRGAALPVSSNARCPESVKSHIMSEVSNLAGMRTLDMETALTLENSASKMC
jgi:hypothetical protein